MLARVLFFHASEGGWGRGSDKRRRRRTQIRNHLRQKGIGIRPKGWVFPTTCAPPPRAPHTEIICEAVCQVGRRVINLIQPTHKLRAETYLPCRDGMMAYRCRNVIIIIVCRLFVVFIVGRCSPHFGHATSRSLSKYVLLLPLLYTGTDDITYTRW